MGQGRKFSIREVSEICNIPSKTLRYYDEIALVVPEFRDESSRYRYYSKDQIITLCIIRKLRKMGFGLKAIQCIISGNTATDLERNIETKLDEIAEEINNLERTYYSMKAFMERLKNGVDLLNIKESLEVEDVSIGELRQCGSVAGSLGGTEQPL